MVSPGLSASSGNYSLSFWQVFSLKIFSLGSLEDDTEESPDRKAIQLQFQQFQCIFLEILVIEYSQLSTLNSQKQCFQIARPETETVISKFYMQEHNAWTST